jgi:hypothetical protein
VAPTLTLWNSEGHLPFGVMVASWFFLLAHAEYPWWVVAAYVAAVAKVPTTPIPMLSTVAVVVRLKVMFMLPRSQW